MKAWATVCALAVAALSTVRAAEDCDLIKIFALVKPLESDENVKKCIAATGFEMLPPANAPTKDQVAKLCANDSCKSVFTSLQKMDIPDCSISILGGVNMKKIINEAFGMCSADATKATSAPSAAPAPAPAATPAPAPAPAVTPTVTPAKAPDAAKPAAPAPAPASVPGPAPAPTPAPTGRKTGKTKRCDA